MIWEYLKEILSKNFQTLYIFEIWNLKIKKISPPDQKFVIVANFASFN